MTAPSRLRQPLTHHEVHRLVERASELVEQFVDLGRIDDERRAQRHHVADHRAQDQALGLGELHRLGADMVLRRERALALLVGDQLDAADQPEPARLADQRMGVERGEPRLTLPSSMPTSMNDEAVTSDQCMPNGI